MSRFLCLLLAFAAFSPSKAQDTLLIDEVRVTTSLIKQSLLRTTTAAAVIDSTQLAMQSVSSLIGAFNAVPGVRMEERSPGSYRLSIRGSLLRSPFGVRNVKIYLNEYPLTDAGGNSYINVLAMNAINRVEILKGPDGSLFGANSGGVVTVSTAGNKERLVAEVAGGSYGFAKQFLGLTKSSGKHLFNFAGSYQRSDGYRENSKLHRLYLQADDHWHYAKRSSLKATVFYSDLYYQTPGGLTQVQYDNDPSQARPATATLPGASAQKAAVYNKMLFSGITHETRIGRSLENVTAVFASAVNFKNPFITNFEERDEDTYGARTFFTISNKLKAADMARWEYIIGGEWQQTASNISNYGNNLGNKGALIASGNIRSRQQFLFNKVKVDLHNRFIIEAGVSLNYYRYRFKDSAQLSKNFKPQWMPRFAVSYSPIKQLSLRSSVSRGYSPPTTAEIRPSDNNIYTGLEAETGVNVEIGFRYFAIKNRFWLDVSAYHYKLGNAIVRQQDSTGAEYFVNAGGTRQNGIELQASFLIISPDNKNSLIKKLQLTNSSTLNDFEFTNYINGTVDYSGNRITGVPDGTIVSGLTLELNRGPYLFIQHNHTTRIPLNDANAAYAGSYDILQTKIGYSFPLRSLRLELYLGIDNITNERYSLGNDLNANGNRFFNAAAKRNFFGGIIFSM